MDMPKVKIPSMNYIVNIAIAMVIVMAIVRFVVPERFKSWFRV
jgi:hypothetical protein